MAMSHVERFKLEFQLKLDDAERMGDFAGSVRMNQAKTGLVWTVLTDNGDAAIDVYLLDGGPGIPHFSHSRVLVVDLTGMGPVATLYPTALTFLEDWNNEQKLGEVLVQD